LRRRFLAGFILLIVAMSAGVTVAATFKNLQVLPADITQADLDATMTRFSEALGVSCAHCHVSDQAPEDDTLPAKSTARDMIRMTVALNRDFFGYEDAPLVTCLTCHQGRRAPQTRRLPSEDPDSFPAPLAARAAEPESHSPRRLPE